MKQKNDESVGAVHTCNFIGVKSNAMIASY